MENPPHYRSDHSDPPCNVEESEPSIPAIRVLTLRVMISTNRLGSDLSSYELLWSKESTQVLALSRDRHTSQNFAGEHKQLTLRPSSTIGLSKFLNMYSNAIVFKPRALYLKAMSGQGMRSKIVGNEDEAKFSNAIISPVTCNQNTNDILHSYLPSKTILA